MNTEKFWLKDPKSLFCNMNLLPSGSNTISSNLNALTRLLLIITFVMYLCNYDNYLTILILGLLLIIIMYMYGPKENFIPDSRYYNNITEKQALQTGIRGFVPGYDSRPHVPPNQACWFDQNTDLLNAAYEITPPIQFSHDEAAKRSYMNAKYELDPLIPAEGFTQIWRNEPDMCGGFTMVPDPLTEFPVEQPELRGQCNYIVRSKIDHLPISQGQNDLISTRPVVEAAYMQNTIDFRNSIMGEHIDRFTRERKHNCPDMPLYRASAGSGGSI
jgi:hypothetical protein